MSSMEIRCPWDGPKSSYSAIPTTIETTDRDLQFPGMPHDVHRALGLILSHTGSLSAAGALLAEYALHLSRK